MNEKGNVNVALIVTLSAVGGLLIIAALMFGVPVWNVWRSGLEGEAALKKQSRQG